MGRPAELGSKVRRGFVWSALSSASLRLVSLVVGMVLARILAPEDFGAYALALMVQAILINLAELGLAADLVRHGNLRERGPTITTIAVVTSSVLALAMWAAAGPFTALMDAPEAASALAVMALTLPMAGLTAVPYAHLQRDFMQGRLFLIDSANVVVGTTVTIVLALDGHGPLSLAIGRVAGQALSTVLQFRLTGERLRFGWRRDVAVSGIRFGLPLACAGLLAWTLLNVDTLVVGATAGTVMLGYYVLAFNVSSWPSSVLGGAVRAVAFPAFAQRGRDASAPDADGVVFASALVFAGALPAGAALALLAGPVVHVVYGERWLPAASALVGLAAFGVVRVVFDLWVAFITACGASAALLKVQALWLVALVPAMVVGVRWGGIAGAGWAHVVVALGVMLPVHLVVLDRLGVRPARVMRPLLAPAIALVPALVLARLVAAAVEPPWARVLASGAVLAVTYGLLLLPWVRRVRRLLAAGAATPDDTTPDDTTPAYTTPDDTTPSDLGVDDDKESLHAP